MVRQSPFRGHPAALLPTSDRRATRQDPLRLYRRPSGGRAVSRAPARAVRSGQVDHDLRPLLPWSGRGHQACGNRGDLPRRVGHVRQRLDQRRPRCGSGQLPFEPGPGRGRSHRACTAHRRPQPALRTRANDRGAAQDHSGSRLPSVHHRRRRHRSRRRRSRTQPDPPFRRDRRSGLPHRGPETGRQEVRAPGRQGAGPLGRAAQAAQRSPLPARHHGSSRDHRRAHRRRVGDVPRGQRRRTRPAVPAGRHQRRFAQLQDRLPRNLERAPRGRRRGDQGALVVLPERFGVRGGLRLARSQRAARADRGLRQGVQGHSGSRCRRDAGQGHEPLRRRMGSRRGLEDLRQGDRRRDRVPQ